MKGEAHQKVQAAHLKRDAYLYVRQSTMHQVLENTESTKRQYGLRERGVALGWPIERIHVVDSDQGRSGSSSADREGFQRLVAEVGMGKAGIVLGLEVSRLARNSVDWHRLLEICALTDTLILDEDGLYNPCDFNDRLLLGLKGAMSEAELHVLRSRLRGGIISKARRGELRAPLPAGFEYDAAGRVVLDPDQQVQESIRHLFRAFQRTGSARATVKAFREAGLSFPKRIHGGPHQGELGWAPLGHGRALQVLHNPRYAGAFFFGRNRTRPRPDGKRVNEKLPREEWLSLLPDAHPGYISWKQYEENQARLQEGAQLLGRDRRKSPAREGPALLQGLAICGVCGERMTVRYHARRGKLRPTYVCQRTGIEKAGPICQVVPGADIDEAIGALLIEGVTPVALEVALRVQQELHARLGEADRLRHQQVERARCEAELARRRYMQVDPDNRLVADSLEAGWNEKLRALAQAQDQYEKQRAADVLVLGDEQRSRILALASDFPRLWRDPRTPQRERKRMVRLMLEDVTLVKKEQLAVHVRFKGGATRSLQLPAPQTAWQLRQTPAHVIAEIDRLLGQHTEAEIATILNERGFASGWGKQFSPCIVQRLRREHDLEGRYERLRNEGMLTVGEMAQLLGVATGTVKEWRNHGLLRAYAYNDKMWCLYEPPGDKLPAKKQGSRLSKRRPCPEVPAHRTKEVQCET